MLDARGYWIARLVLLRGLGLVCLLAFLVALNQFRALCGERGLLPASHFMKQMPFRQSPSLFYLFPQDVAFTLAAWAGVVLSCLVLTGISDRYGTWMSMLTWALIWVLYMSFVNVGQTFYSFGWESILLEAMFFAIFFGSSHTTPQQIPIWLMRWLLFRVMFGAGLIKLRGDPCWRNLTCLNWYFETQPMPNPLSWYFHWAPAWVHEGGVLFNHFVELIVPFGFFLPQPVASIAGILTIVFQLVLLASGNLSWLNLITIVLAFSTIDDRIWSSLLHLHPLQLQAPLRAEVYAQIGIGALVFIMSIPVVVNMLSARQMMNFDYNPFHLVGTYGAFGSVTRPRYEVVVEGTEDAVITSATQWRIYQFKGKPTDPTYTPPQIAPYHLRLDWLMWFAAMSNYQNYPWFVNFMAKLLEGDSATLGLLRYNPFSAHPPRYVRALLYEYHFTTPEEHRAMHAWWKRKLISTYFPAISLDSPGLQRVLREEGWLPAR